MRQIERFAAPPAAIFEALMDESKHAAFTGYPAKIDARAGGLFQTCGERNYGYTVALVPDRTIVQARRHRDWPDSSYSIATFALSGEGGGTRLDFTQEGVPEEALGWIDSGWRSTYWEALRRWLAAR